MFNEVDRDDDRTEGQRVEDARLRDEQAERDADDRDEDDVQPELAPTVVVERGPVTSMPDPINTKARQDASAALGEGQPGVVRSYDVEYDDDGNEVAPVAPAPIVGSDNPVYDGLVADVKGGRVLVSDGEGNSPRGNDFSAVGADDGDDIAEREEANAPEIVTEGDQVGLSEEGVAELRAQEGSE